MYGLETVALTKSPEAELEVAEPMMLRFSSEVTRRDRIRKEYIIGTVQVEQFGDKVKDSRLRWLKEKVESGEQCHLRKNQTGTQTG